MTEINTRDFLRSVIDDIVEATALPKGNRISKRPYSRSYKFGSQNGDLVINLSLINHDGKVLTPESSDFNLVEPMIHIDIWRGYRFISKDHLFDQKIPLADPDYEIKAIKIINGVLGLAY